MSRVGLAWVQEILMSELKRNPVFQFASGPQSGGIASPFIDESQPWKTQELRRSLAAMAGDANTGCDPYNTIGTRAIKPLLKDQSTP